ncbi:MAG TPA: NFACT family protein [Candidatus Brocadiia bacterium]|nr:NFACT family protein [Candidatus Brocadiia bacterium]
MSLSADEIALAIGELREPLRMSALRRIDQADARGLLLHFYTGERRHHVLVSIHPKASRICAIHKRIDAARDPNAFVDMVRAKLTGARLLDIEQAQGDRVVVLELLERSPDLQPRAWKLTAEMLGARGNIYLLTPDGRIAAAWEKAMRRPLAQGREYEPPAPHGKPSAGIRQEIVRAASMEHAGDAMPVSHAIEAIYDPLQEGLDVCEKRAGLETAIARALKTATTRESKIMASIREAAGAERALQLGEILKANLGAIRKGAKQVVLPDFYNPELAPVAIDLDPTLTAIENAEVYFRKHRKARSGEGKLRARLAETSREREAIEDVSARLASAGSFHEIARIEESLIELGALKAPKPPAAPGARETKRFRRFLSAEGMEILVGRSNSENDELTIRTARGNDIWLHVQDWAGSHVVIRKPKNRTASLETLLDAAHLAVHFSKLRGTPKAEVIYTPAKNVRKPKGAAPGRVAVGNSKTLFVAFEPERLERVLNSGEKD